MKPGDLVRVRKAHQGLTRILFMDSEGFTIRLSSNEIPILVYVGEESWALGGSPVIKLLHPTGVFWYAKREHICRA